MITFSSWFWRHRYDTHPLYNSHSSPLGFWQTSGKSCLWKMVRFLEPWLASKIGTLAYPSDIRLLHTSRLLACHLERWRKVTYSYSHSLLTVHVVSLVTPCLKVQSGLISNRSHLDPTWRSRVRSGRLRADSSLDFTFQQGVTNSSPALSCLENNFGGLNEAGDQVVILNSAIDIESTKCERLQI